MDWKILITKVKAWLLAFAANLWEDCLKEYLHNQLRDLVSKASFELVAFRNSEKYLEIRNNVINALFDKIQLPMLLKPLKGLIKSILINTLEKQIDEKLGKLSQIA